MRAKGAMALVILAVSAGCSLATPYAPMGWRGGYREQPLDSTTWLIEVQLNAVTPTSRAYEYWQRRADEVARRESCDSTTTLDLNLDVNDANKPRLIGRLKCVRRA